MSRIPADYNQEGRIHARTIELKEPSAKTLRERRTRERDAAKWLRYYFPGIYRLPFGDVHFRIIEEAEYSVAQGARCAVAGPRGTGKSYVIGGLALKALLEGRVRFPVVMPWDAKQLKKMLGFWKKALCFNELLARDYPEICTPFVASRGSYHKVSTFVDPDGNPLGAQLIVSEGMIVLPHSLGVIGGATINGNPLGLNYTTDAGEGLRPDLVFIDDPQDRDTAMSRLQINSTIQQIDFDVAGMGGPDTSMPILLACTVKQVGDVAEHYLEHPEWRSVRIGQILKWPADMDGWQRWNEVRLEGESERDGGKKARAHYRQNKEALTAGMDVSWDQRFMRKAHDQAAEPDAFYSAMCAYFAMGEAAFMAERQNQPQEAHETVYDLSPETVAKCIYPKRKRCDLPAESVVIETATDINHYGMHSACIGFANDQTASCAWYGLYERTRGGGIVPKNCPDKEAKRLVYEALVMHGQEIASLPLSRAGAPAHVGLWVIDGGYMPDVVRRYLEGPGRELAVQCVMARGYAGDRYRPTGKNVIGTPRENTHQAEGPVSGRFLAFNADYWREVAQRAWLASPGAPGGISLFDGTHTEFAEQICSERLLEKLQGNYGPLWRWVRIPGAWNDWGDAVTMCYVGAVWQGVGTQGAVRRPRRYVERRRPKVQARAGSMA